LPPAKVLRGGDLWPYRNLRHRGSVLFGPSYERRGASGKIRRGVIGTSEEGRPEASELPAVAGLELAQQRRDVALDRAFGDEQAGRDLGVAQMLLHRSEHLDLARGDAAVNQCGRIRHPSIIALACCVRPNSSDHGVCAVLTRQSQ
jgi:hypothetical protein